MPLGCKRPAQAQLFRQPLAIVTDNHYSVTAGVDRVQVKLKRSTLAPGGKLFARLKIVQP